MISDILTKNGSALCAKPLFLHIRAHVELVCHDFFICRSRIGNFNDELTQVRVLGKSGHQGRNIDGNAVHSVGNLHAHLVRVVHPPRQ